MSDANSKPHAPSVNDCATALAGLQQFLAQPRHAETPHLLLLSSDCFGRAHLAETIGRSSVLTLEAGRPRIVEVRGRSSIIACEFEDEGGALHKCLLNASSYALLLCIMLLGQSAFLNSTEGRPFLKVFGRADEKAGIVFARLLLQAEEGERVEYRDGDQLNLTFSNLTLASGRAKRGSMEWHPLALGRSASLPDELFPGTQTEKFEAAKKLLRSVMERVETELGDLNGPR